MKYLIAIISVFICSISFAQNSFFSSAKSVSLDYKDAPVRTVLEQMIKQSEIKNYVISNDVEGLITLKLENYGFENALKIVMRANKVPLLYKIENNILIIEKRRETILLETPKPDIISKPENNSSWEKIHLTYIDPLDLQVIFGPILNMRQFTRYFNNMGGNGFMGNGNMNNMGNSGGSNNRNR